MHRTVVRSLRGRLCQLGYGWILVAGLPPRRTIPLVVVAQERLQVGPRGRQAALLSMESQLAVCIGAVCISSGLLAVLSAPVEMKQQAAIDWQ